MTSVPTRPGAAVEREFTVRSRSQWQLAICRFRRDPLAMGGPVTLLLWRAA